MWSSSMPYVPMNWMAAANAVMKYPLSALSASGELRLNAYSCMTSSQGTCACTVMLIKMDRKSSADSGSVSLRHVSSQSCA